MEVSQWDGEKVRAPSPHSGQGRVLFGGGLLWGDSVPGLGFVRAETPCLWPALVPCVCWGTCREGLLAPPRVQIEGAGWLGWVCRGSVFLQSVAELGVESVQCFWLS